MSTIEEAADAVLNHYDSALLSVGDPRYAEVMDWIYHEAALLDGIRLHEWLDLLTDDIRYRMPNRVTQHREVGDGVSSSSYYFDDDKPMLHSRVRRQLETSSAWADDPPVRTRRLITNVRVRAVDEGFEVCSSLLLLRNRWDQPHQDLLSVERTDSLVRTDEGLRLRRRLIIPDFAVHGTPNLSVLL